MEFGITWRPSLQPDRYQPQPIPTLPPMHPGNPGYYAPPQRPIPIPIPNPGPTPEQVEQERQRQLQEIRRQQQAQQAAQREAWEKYVNAIYGFHTTGVDVIYTKAVSDRARDMAAKQDILKLKEQLLRDTRWHTSDVAVLQGLIAGTLMAVSDRIITLLGFEPHPAARLPGVVTRYSYAVLLNAAKTWSFNEELIMRTIIDEMRNDTIAACGSLPEFVNSLYNLAATMQDVYSLPEQQKELRNEVKQQLEAMDKEIARYEALLKKSSRVIEARARLHKALNDFLQSIPKS